MNCGLGAVDIVGGNVGPTENVGILRTVMSVRKNYNVFSMKLIRQIILTAVVAILDSNVFVVGVLLPVRTFEAFVAFEAFAAFAAREMPQEPMFRLAFHLLRARYRELLIRQAAIHAAKPFHRQRYLTGLRYKSGQDWKLVRNAEIVLWHHPNFWKFQEADWNCWHPLLEKFPTERPFLRIDWRALPENTKWLRTWEQKTQSQLAQKLQASRNL